MPNKNHNYNFVTIGVILLIQLGCLYFIKYSNQGLSLSTFSIWKTGNLLNLLIYAGIIGALFFILKKNKVSITKKTIVLMLIITWFFLILSFVSTKEKMFPTSLYVYSQPADKVLTGLFFLFFLITLFYFLIYYWSTLLSKQKPKIYKSILFSVLLLFALFIFVMIYIDNMGYTSGRWSLRKSKENIGVVLGAAVWSGNIPSPTLSARVDKALELLNQGFIGKIVLTGGKAPGELPESEVAYEYAKAKGADTSVFRIERSTSSTTDQIRWIINNVSMKDSLAEIILISDAYHLPRAIEISKFFNLNVKVAESVHKMNFNDMIYNKIRESIALFNFWNFAL